MWAMSWWMPILLEKLIGCPISVHPSLPCAGRSTWNLLSSLGMERAATWEWQPLCVRWAWGYLCQGEEGWGAVGSSCASQELFPAAAEAEAEDRYRSSVRGASLCRGSLRTSRPEEGAAGG